MINPAVIALFISSGIMAAMVLYASFFALRILRGWDPQSGSERQLELERRTYLISTLLMLALAFHLASIFLFIYTADRLHTLFYGAMCGAGTLNANPYGYPALVLKIALFLLAALWIALNHADSRSPQYPLIRVKYWLLLLLLPFSLAEAVTQGVYLSGLDADVITSCCGTLFSTAKGSDGAWAAIGPAAWLDKATVAALALSVIVGSLHYRSIAWGPAFAALSVALLVLGTGSLIFTVSPYIYELPTHHCPFCVLQSDYHYIGYPMYAGILGGSAAGLSAGVLGVFRRARGLETDLPRIVRRLTAASLALFGLFAALCVYGAAASNLEM